MGIEARKQKGEQVVEHRRIVGRRGALKGPPEDSELILVGTEG